MQTTAASASNTWSAALVIVRRRIRQIGISLGAAVISAIAATIVSMIVDGGRSVDEAYRSITASEGAALRFTYALVAAPLIETLILGWILLLLLERGINRHVAVVVSATLWTAVHLMQGLAGLSVFFPFVVYSYLFVERRNPPHSDGYLLAMMAHFFYNLIVMAAAYSGGLI